MKILAIAILATAQQMTLPFITTNDWFDIGKPVIEAKQAGLPQSGDIVQIGDFQFVVISRADFERMQLTVDDLREKWEKMNSHEAGRVALHGKRGHTTITNGTIQVEYADGHVHVEPMKNAAIVPFTRPTRKTADATIRVKHGGPIVPPGLDEIRRKRRAARAVTNEVSVTVGPGRESK